MMPANVALRVAAVLAFASAAFFAAVHERSLAAGPVALPELPHVAAVGGRVTLDLRAQLNVARTMAFGYAGGTVPPVIRIVPGNHLHITYRNALPEISSEKCALGPCMDMTNLHFHGLAISPNAPQDDVLGTMAMPGKSLTYDIDLPKRAVPGLYWYHTHPHGESDRQDEDGMSGAIVVEGIDRYVPEVRGLPERVMMIRAQDLGHDKAANAALEQRVSVDRACEVHKDETQAVNTLNGVVRPTIVMRPGQREFWRIVNASADAFTDLAIDGQRFHIVAIDGIPVRYHDSARAPIVATHIVVPPAGRVEAIVDAPSGNQATILRARCLDLGPDGDPNPGMVIADITSSVNAVLPSAVPVVAQAPVFDPVDTGKVAARKPTFVVRFTEGHHAFFINRRAYTPDAAPLVRVKTGSLAHWRIVNDTHEVHPFHIHQTSFLAYAMNGKALGLPLWRDTVDVPPDGYVDLVMDFRSARIKGMSVMHCHILRHEDKGMMAKVLFE